MGSELEARIKAVIASTLHVDEGAISRKVSIADHLGADSLDFVSLLLAIEHEFHLDIHDEDAAELVTVGQLIDYVELGTAIMEASAAKHLQHDVGVPLR